MKIFITGEPKIGKTTLIKEISDILMKRGVKISGFITSDLISEGKRVGFNIVDIVTKEERIFASKNIETKYKFGSYYLNIDNLDEIFNKIVKRDYEILIIDEIGKMEFCSKNFREKINCLMKSDTNILSTLHRDFVENFKIYGKIFTLTSNNRKIIKNEIFKINNQRRENMNEQNKKREIKWEIDIPLLNNKILIRQMIMVFFITYIIISVLMSTIFLVQGETESIPMLLLMFFLVCLGLFVLSILVMLLIFGNRMTLRFTVNDKGVLYEMVDKRGKKLTNLAIFSGVLSKKATTTGSGLIAKSREAVFINYKNIIKLVPKDKENVILLKNEWRTLLAIYCKEENYNEVKEFLNEIFKEKMVNVIERKIKNPLPKYILLSLLTIIMSIPIFNLPYPFEINLFVPILILFFTLGSIWLIRLLFFVTIGGSIYTIIFIIVKLFEKTESFIFDRTYFWYELISGEDIFALILLSISLLYFISFSIYSLKGNFSSMLERDSIY